LQRKAGLNLLHGALARAMELKLGDCALAIFPTVKGLASELPELEAAWVAARPQAL